MGAPVPAEAVERVSVYERVKKAMQTTALPTSMPVELGFDSYMLQDEDLPFGGFRLLEVDNQLVLPANVPIRFLITSTDVLHSFAVPSLGIKVDACPGRLNHVSTFIKRTGCFYGQCSEICGTGHAFMPIAVRVVNPTRFFNKSEGTFRSWYQMK